MEHVDIPVGEIHAPFQWLPADSAARLAIVPISSDVHKLALQLDDLSQWLLVDDSPVTWEQQAAQGPQGDPGPQGEPGEQGPQGEPGNPATNLVTSVAGKTGAVTLTKADVGLADVDNTADSDKPISTATQTALNGKEPAIASGTTSQFWRGDKTWRDFATDVRASVLTGLSTAVATVVAGTDSVLVAIGKLQAQITAQQGPRFRAFLPANTTLTSGAMSLAALSSENFDPSNTFDAATNYRFQPAVAGYYWLPWSVFMFNSSGTLTSTTGALHKNGAEISRNTSSGVGVTIRGVQGGDLVYLNGTTDYVDLRVAGVISSGSVTLTGAAGGLYTWLAGHYVGP